MKEQEHALLSASGATKWLNCPPSARLEKEFETTNKYAKEGTNKYAKEGTDAHALAERLLRRIVNLGVRSTADVKETNKEMMRYCTDYAVYVSKKVSENGKCFIEYKTDFSNIVPEGFGTIDALIFDKRKIEIVDFKYGAGKKVEAKDNPQLMLYSLGALNEFNDLCDIEFVKMSIFQPRMDNISEWMLSVKEIRSWGENIKPAAELAFAGKGEYLAGGHCQWCRAKNACAARAKQFLKNWQITGETISDEEMLGILPALEGLEKWAKETREYAKNKALEGHKWEGWKIVEGKGKRAFVDKAIVVCILRKAGYKQKDIVDTELKSLTALEKLLKKEKFEQLLSPQIKHMPGAPALTPESDNRKELITKIEFKQEEEKI